MDEDLERAKEQTPSNAFSNHPHFAQTAPDDPAPNIANYERNISPTLTCLHGAFACQFVSTVERGLEEGGFTTGGQTWTS
ncbi:hypothetical protein ACOMHN_008786 [Nucella lapillus]